MSLESAGRKSSSSSSSTTPNSTSTYEYSHEPYDTFQAKVLALAQSLGSVQEVELQHAKGGSFNRVVIARLTLQSSSVAGIFRIPHFPNVPDEEDQDDTSSAIDAEILDQAAVLQFLQSQHIPAPSLIAYDASPNNAIKSPYVFQELAGGTALNLIYDAMSAPEKLQVVEAMVDILARMEKVRFPSCGHVVAQDTLSTTATKASKLTDTLQDVPSMVRGFAVSASHNTMDNARYSSCSTEDLIRQLLAAQKDADAVEGWPENPVNTMWQGLCDMFDDMCSLGFFSDLRDFSREGSTLYHWDLEARNIIVKRTSAQHDISTTVDSQERHQEPQDPIWTIDKVIDFDKVQAIPPLLARKPPIWLWDFSDDDDRPSLPDVISTGYDGDVDLISPSRYDRSGGRLSAENQALRSAFEEGLTRRLQEIYPGYNADVYWDEAYGRGRWVRRLARFAIQGCTDGQHYKRMPVLEQEWLAARSTYEPPKLNHAS